MAKTDDRITVITPSMPGREWELSQACASVTAQTVQPFAHLIRVQAPPEKYGPSPIALAGQRNRLIEAVTTEWVASLDDDDIWHPDHLETLAPYLSGADVVYSYCQSDVVPDQVDVTGWPQAKLIDALRKKNRITSSAFMRRAVLLEVGGYPERFSIYNGTFKGTPCTWEDWALWLRLAEHGATFRCVPKVTWTYRFDPQKSSQMVWARRRHEMGSIAGGA